MYMSLYVCVVCEQVFATDEPDMIALADSMQVMHVYETVCMCCI
jgi:hypothetical protein